ncbi:class I SAM-dependent RNA methyltransferase [Microbacterium resistens]|uniref:class I SAM-dependent RNA methyltransferase n=1 Tax=Microbacterium resistens TaxID=156977 RepID=UPI001E5BEEEC|nr:TRAM domain-containing protein [Microbacterium resistens]
MTSADSGDLLDLDVTGIAHGGVSVARHDGRVVFVADAIPGERVRARVTDASKPAFWRAVAVEVPEPSSDRRPHLWAEASIDRDPEARPGGAEFGHIVPRRQRALKRQVLAEALDRFAGGGVDAPEVAAVSDHDGGWRTRVTLHADADGHVGPYAARSHRIVPVEDLPLARPSIAAAARTLRARGEGRVELVEASDGQVRILRKAAAAREGGAGKGARRRAPRAPRPVPEVLVERAAGREFRVDADGFWQVHPEAADTLDAAVADLLADRVDPDSAHLDLYGGVGLFAATLGRLGARTITTVESSPRAIAHARENLGDLGVEAITARVDRFLADRRRDEAAARAHAGGTVVLDPPRSGAGRAVVEDVVALAPSAVVYVACDPVAFARDLGTFRARGYDVEELRAFDLFPNTHHFEVVARLVPVVGAVASVG